jgi:formamidopyrimidine-DNA glycosylase
MPMPELPEVETVRTGLEPVMQNKVILKAEVNRPDLRWPFPPNMAQRLTGACVVRLRRRAKYILVDLDTDETLLIHLGMSGRMLISDMQVGDFQLKNFVKEKHDHVVLYMANNIRITFNDARRFGMMDLVPTPRVDKHKLLASLGLEPLGNSFNETYLQLALVGKKSPIKNVLLDQRIIAGLGNIYVCEVLHHAHISPKRRSGSLSKKRVNKIVPIVREVLLNAILAGGSSLKDYRQADGELGYFQHSFGVYGRESLPCYTDNCDGIIKRIQQSGRSTFYCPTCQT